MRELAGQLSTGPSGMADQSNARIRSPNSPAPANGEALGGPAGLLTAPGPAY